MRGDNDLIDDQIKPAFEKLHDGLAIMQAQWLAWFPKDWLAAEKTVCESAFYAIENIFSAFKNASHPDDVTLTPDDPYVIINNQQLIDELDTFTQAIDALYKPTDKMIVSGRDPSIRLLELINARYQENHLALGGVNTPRNNAVMQTVFGYCQRYAPINFLQAFAMGIVMLVKDNLKLIRSFEYGNWLGHDIYPLDLYPFRLGYESYCGERGVGFIGCRPEAWVTLFNGFLSIKNSHYETTASVSNSLKC